ncbi:MAG TPA: hypothetical protein PKC97_17950 [Burkholderiaceae bacterium]|nr:hypothetical protein [Burkholderiaceae bacterium]
MQCDWRTHTFGQLIEQRVLEVGDGYRAKNDELGGNGLIFLRAGHVTDTHIDLADVERFIYTGREKFGPKVARPGDVVVTTKGNSTGRVAFVAKDMPPFVYSPHLSYWRSRSATVLPAGFLRAWSRGQEFGAQLEAMSRSTDMAPYLSLSDQHRLRITLPPIDVQVGIAELGDAIEARIDLLRQTNATLESIAQALFKSWFIDFDPVRANAEGREPEGMDAATAALFPAEFEESALGLIPKGWRVATVADAVEFNPLRALPKGTESRYLEMANAPTSGHRPLERTELRAFSSGCKFRHGDALLAKITPCLENGKSAFVDFLEEHETGWGSTEFIVLRAKPVLPLYGAYLLARYEPFRQFAIQAMTGTSGRQRVDLSRLKQFPLALPADSSIAAAAEPMLRALQLRIAANDEQAKTLAVLRDTLLPRLISGKLRLPEAEAVVAEAATA